MPKKLKKISRGTNKFFDDCDAMEAEMFASAFFDEIDELLKAAHKEVERLKRYRERRAKNEGRASNVLKRLRRVESIDLYMMTKHIGPNWLGEKTLQFSEVKRLAEKKLRIEWFLLGLYRYLAFDAEVNGWSVRRGLHYTRHRQFWYKIRAVLTERERQRIWDAKRAKVRKRRNGPEPPDERLSVVYKLKHGIGDTPPI